MNKGIFNMRNQFAAGNLAASAKYLSAACLHLCDVDEEKYQNVTIILDLLGKMKLFG
jgi:hypothetical protein